jgi:hypothetical protein|tara:strand:- start:469 stop:720 length:252 start_codon:yes stop_codon:yes gene_type:complete
MGYQKFEIITIQQPVQLLAGERDYFLTKMQRPVKPLFLKSLIVETKTIIFPEQNLDPIASFVGKDEQLFAKRTASHGLFYDGR